LLNFKITCTTFWQIFLILFHNIYCVGVYNISTGPMQHHKPVPQKSHPWRPWFVDLAPLAMNLARRSFIGGRSDDPVPILFSSSSFLLESAKYLRSPVVMVMAMATTKGCSVEVDLGGAGLDGGGESSKKMSLWSLRPLCSVGVRTGELPHALPSLPALWREKMLSYVSFCAGDVAASRMFDERRIVGHRNQPIAARDRWANCKRFPKSILS
jgi:hypothetical protein